MPTYKLTVGAEGKVGVDRADTDSAGNNIAASFNSVKTDLNTIDGKVIEAKNLAANASSAASSANAAASAASSKADNALNVANTKQANLNLQLKEIL